MPPLETSETVASEQQQDRQVVDALYHTLVRTTLMLLFPTDASSPLDELPLSQVRCLNVVSNDEGRKMQEIATRLRIKLPAMSQMVDRLVRKGLMERRPDPADRRVARLHLTPTAKEMITEARQIRMKYLHKIAASLEPARIEQMNADLRLLIVAAEKCQRLNDGSTGIGDANLAVGTVDGHDPLMDVLAERARNSRS